MLKQYLFPFVALAAMSAFALTPATASAASRHGGSHVSHSGGHAVHVSHSAGHAVHVSHGGGHVIHNGGGFRHGGNFGHDGHRGFYGYGLGLGYPYSYGGYSPYYYGDNYYDYSPTYVVPPTYYDDDSGYPSYDTMPPAEYGAVTPPAAVQDNTAHIHLIVPPNAQVWFNGAPTQQMGSDREFQTPALEPGRTFTYEVKASWIDADGNTVTRTRQVDVTANANITVDFTRAI